MSVAARLLAAVALWALCAALGWWWQQPDAPAPPPPIAADTSDPLRAVPRRNQDDSLARRIAAADPMGLKRIAAAQQRAQGTAPGEPAADLVQWRVGALVVRGAERYAVLTATDQTPLRVTEGERLPDGDRVRSIAPARIVLQSPRGRLRTIYLTEP